MHLYYEDNPRDISIVSVVLRRHISAGLRCFPSSSHLIRQSLTEPNKMAAGKTAGAFPIVLSRNPSENSAQINEIC